MYNSSHRVAKGYPTLSENNVMIYFHIGYLSVLLLALLPELSIVSNLLGGV